MKQGDESNAGERCSCEDAAMGGLRAAVFGGPEGDEKQAQGDVGKQEWKEDIDTQIGGARLPAPEGGRNCAKAGGVDVAGPAVQERGLEGVSNGIGCAMHVDLVLCQASLNQVRPQERQANGNPRQSEIPGKN